MERFIVVAGSFVTVLFWTFLDDNPDVLLGGSIATLGLATLLFLIPLFRKVIGAA